ncbi:XRE family transcriptional regulator [Rheinheimera aquimaris]|jgi:hypothetical protein|uniref:XRE family transcriptional regulator n=1 Tax=Rheinheimera aquimaris TaxID=412437 RepID=UPI000E9C78C3|nr:XRE family transcriptional regulator [Rheinheimera aquimaris]MCD1600278.1 hypothetical protein [Rheinheimera aquimaris]HBN90439.1 transcriptional regulator [Rheinheimera sp.]|tara:strand:+ start:3089 stop:3967 length:879 start_codon:yes stop_codon:yes gene_type:complete
MSLENENKIRVLIGLSEEDEPELIAMTGGVVQAKKWEKLVVYLARSAEDGGETGYITYPLKMDMGAGFLTLQILSVLKAAGTEIPKEFPKAIDFDLESMHFSDDEDESDKLIDLLDENPYSKLIYGCFRALVDVYGFYVAYIEDPANALIDLVEFNYSHIIENIEPSLMNLALAKLDDDSVQICSEFERFRFNTLNDYKIWLDDLKKLAYQHNVPLGAEVMHLLYDDLEELSVQAERESLGFNDNKIHPDIYMNELLVGMRLMHHVLPKICEKLGITSEELKLDPSDFTSKG